MATSDSTRGKSPAFQFYPGDFLSSDNVDRMSMTERGMYITLMAKYWLKGGLPADLKELAGMCRMKPDKFSRIWTKGTLHLCFSEKNGRMMQSRLDDERRKQAEFKRRQSDRANTRWNKAVKPPKADAVALPVPASSPQCSSSSSLSLSSSSKRESAPAQAGPRNGTGLLRGPRPEAAFDGGRVWVLHKTHADFLALRNGNEAELRAWYEHIAEEYNYGSRKHLEPGPNMFKFWEARYAEKWPASASKPADTGPTYVRASEHPSMRRSVQ